MSVDSIRKPQPSFKRGKAENAHAHLTWCNGMMRGLLKRHTYGSKITTETTKMVKLAVVYEYK